MSKLELKRDMVPIFVNQTNRRGGHNASFKAPVCIFNERVMSACKYDDIVDELVQLREHINDKILSYEEPFDRLEHICNNIERYTIWDQHYLIREEEGLTGAFSGRNANSGDIYRTVEGTPIFSHAPPFVQKHFSEEEAWYCHNVDNYIQAVVTRELTIEYFNYIMKKAKQLEQLDIEEERG